MTLQTQLTALAEAIGADVKTLALHQGNPAVLTTTAKTSLVAAINELKSLVNTSGGGGADIDDSAGAGDTDKTWSADKLIAALAQVKSDIIDGAPEAYDTLKEIADYLSDNDTAIAGLLTAIGNRVSYRDAQTLTVGEQLTACGNIGIGDPATDFAALYAAAKA